MILLIIENIITILIVILNIGFFKRNIWKWLLINVLIINIVIILVRNWRNSCEIRLIRKIRLWFYMGELFLVWKILFRSIYNYWALILSGLIGWKSIFISIIILLFLEKFLLKRNWKYLCFFIINILRGWNIYFISHFYFIVIWIKINHS